MKKIFIRSYRKRMFGPFFFMLFCKKLELQINKLINIFILIILISSCQTKDEYFRPNLEEKLCCITIIDADDTTNYSFSWLTLFEKRNSLRYFSLEKSKQSEYYYELKDSLQEFSYSISSLTGQLFNYENSLKTENLFYMELPDSLKFISGEKYFLSAKEKTLEAIFAETIVPEPPPILNLVSLEKKEYKRNSDFTGSLLIWGEKYYSAEVRLSFTKSNNKKNYYALFLDGKGSLLPNLPFNMPNAIYFGPIDFFVRESNTPYFISEIQGINMVHLNGWGFSQEEADPIEIDLAYAVFIDGGQIHGDDCIISLSIPFGDTRAPISSLRNLRIKLLRITEEFYLFEKSLYTYYKVKNDPFSEPVYLNGNVKGGNGIFTICRSSVLELSPNWHYE